ncbi:MAG: DUF2306 domain-containing protein [Paracoccaceae bacterium]|nr:DUF2306 domain-containing protein [Paracoccaceae bacterium]
MSFAPLYQSGLIVTAHAFAALAALGLGAAQLLLAKGTTGHRVVGYIWVSLLGLVALSSFWIHDIRQFGPFSLIHALSVYTLFGLVFGIRAAQRGDIPQHRSTMRQIFYIALIGAGAFTLLPGRDMHLVVFGP